MAPSKAPFILASKSVFNTCKIENRLFRFIGGFEDLLAHCVGRGRRVSVAGAPSVRVSEVFSGVFPLPAHLSDSGVRFIPISQSVRTELHGLYRADKVG